MIHKNSYNNTQNNRFISFVFRTATPSTRGLQNGHLTFSSLSARPLKPCYRHAPPAPMSKRFYLGNLNSC